ncbi:hypothetical protein IFO70_23615 [Phormidium tenue FACHB-886]|nr:hypothetical protein [Phormidium tenue FACHB-886]
MKRIEPKEKLKRLFQTMTESTEETIRGSGRPASGGGDCPPIFDIVDSVAGAGSGTTAAIKVRRSGVSDGGNP